MNLSSSLISSCKFFPGGADFLFLDFSLHDNAFKLNLYDFSFGIADKLLVPFPGWFRLLLCALFPFWVISVSSSAILWPIMSSSFLFLLARFSYKISKSVNFLSVAASCCLVCWCCFLSSSNFSWYVDSYFNLF